MPMLIASILAIPSSLLTHRNFDEWEKKKPRPNTKLAILGTKFCCCDLWPHEKKNGPAFRQSLVGCGNYMTCKQHQIHQTKLLFFFFYYYVTCERITVPALYHITRINSIAFWSDELWTHDEKHEIKYNCRCVENYGTIYNGRNFTKYNDAFYII